MDFQIKPIAKPHRLKDGTCLSIQASTVHYCSPRDDEGPYSAVEVGYINDGHGNTVTPPETWREYADGEKFPSGVYGYIPIALVQSFCDDHGGILVHV